MTTYLLLDATMRTVLDRLNATNRYAAEDRWLTQIESGAVLVAPIEVNKRDIAKAHERRRA